MSDLWHWLDEQWGNVLNGLGLLAFLLLPGIFIGGSIAYLTAKPPSVGPGTRVWHLSDLWDWLTWKTSKR